MTRLDNFRGGDTWETDGGIVLHGLLGGQNQGVS